MNSAKLLSDNQQGRVLRLYQMPLGAHKHATLFTLMASSLATLLNPT